MESDSTVGNYYIKIRNDNKKVYSILLYPVASASTRETIRERERDVKSVIIFLILWVNIESKWQKALFNEYLMRSYRVLSLVLCVDGDCDRSALI